MQDHLKVPNLSHLSSLSFPTRSVTCDEKKIVFAYHIMCQDCASKAQVCAKCQLPKEIAEEYEVPLFYC